MKIPAQQPVRLPRRQFLQLATGAALGSMSMTLLAQSVEAVEFDVYKEPTCGCCVNWIDHMQGHGFSTRVHHPLNLADIKADLGIAPAMQSCHTALHTSGYVFEGHVPARYISQFLAEPPSEALGLAVPGMPLGSPGMEVGQRFSAYEVVLLKQDGSSEVYAKVNSPADQ